MALLLLVFLLMPRQPPTPQRKSPEISIHLVEICAAASEVGIEREDQKGGGELSVMILSVDAGCGAKAIPMRSSVKFVRGMSKF